MPLLPLVGTLAYIWDREADIVLLIRRNARKDDDQYGKVNGLGGKVEPDESIVESLRRELKEEACIELQSIELRGTVTWSNFGPKLQEWLGFVFLVDDWVGEIPESNNEGTLEWVARTDLLAACQPDCSSALAERLPMWPGDRHFLPLVFDGDARQFHGTMPYDQDRPLKWSFERI